jgi:hypothetical protein
MEAYNLIKRGANPFKNIDYIPNQSKKVDESKKRKKALPEFDDEGFTIVS